MQPQDELPPLEKLGKDIQRLKEKTAPKAPPGPVEAGLAMRMGLELVSGVLVGTAIGIALDRWLETKPWFMLVCFFLGAAGGGLNLYRLAQSQARNMDDENATDEKDKDT